MHLHSEIVVPQDICTVSKFFFEPSNLAKWDRSVTRVVPTSSIAGVGTTFETIAPSGMKMCYRVTELEYGKSTKILLTESRMFKNATWHFQFQPSAEGTKISCDVYLRLHLRYLFLIPVLYLNQGALLRDLKYLRAALNENANQSI